MARFPNPARSEILAGECEIGAENGAGNGVRTRDPQLGKLMLYQLSYSREENAILGLAANRIKPAAG